jgi:DNA-binding LacI/PurR family transcriptional regulator
MPSQNVPPVRRKAPKTRAVAQQLRQHIVAQLKPGSQLPTFNEMEASFGVSRGVLRGAVTRLKDDGFIHAVDRRGLFVADRPPHLGRIALVFPQNPTHPEWPRFFTALQQQAAGIHESRDDIRFATYFDVSAQPASASFDELCRDVHAHRVASLMLMPGTHELGRIEPIASATLPRLFICGDPTAGRTPSITVDTPQMCERMAQWLHGRKRSRIAAVGLWETSVPLLGTLRKKRIVGKPHWALTVARANAEDVRTLVALLMDYPAKDRPDGLMVLDDNLTEHAISGLVATGIRIGKDADVIAHCNWPWPIPTLAPVQRIGFHARHLLEEAIRIAEQVRQGVATATLAVKLPACFEDETVVDPSTPATTA